MKDQELRDAFKEQIETAIALTEGQANHFVSESVFREKPKAGDKVIFAMFMSSGNTFHYLRFFYEREMDKVESVYQLVDNVKRGQWYVLKKREL